MATVDLTRALLGRTSIKLAASAALIREFFTDGSIHRPFGESRNGSRAARGVNSGLLELDQAKANLSPFGVAAASVTTSHTPTCGIAIKLSGVTIRRQLVNRATLRTSLQLCGGIKYRRHHIDPQMTHKKNNLSRASIYNKGYKQK